jgi:hypothetical protein
MVGVHRLDARQGTMSLKSGTVSSMLLGVTLKLNKPFECDSKFKFSNNSKRCCSIGIGWHLFVISPAGLMRFV